MQRCGDCGRWQHYPRTMCATCWSPHVDWAEPAGTGTVWTLTIVHRPGHPAWSEDAPYALAIVELDEGPRLLANVVGCAPEEIYVGMPARVVFEPRDGYAVVQFTPIASSGSDRANDLD